MKRTQPRPVLRASFAQLHVLANDLDDIGLLLELLGKVVGHGRARLSVADRIGCGLDAPLSLSIVRREGMLYPEVAIFNGRDAR